MEGRDLKKWIQSKFKDDNLRKVGTVDGRKEYEWDFDWALGEFSSDNKPDPAEFSDILWHVLHTYVKHAMANNKSASYVIQLDGKKIRVDVEV